MPFRVYVQRFGQVHFHAGCNDCDFSTAISSDATPSQVRQAVRYHVAKTGHRAWIEAGTHTAYAPASQPSQEQTGEREAE